MEIHHKREWAKAQNITFSVDLIDAAKKQMKFLATVDRHQHDLFEGTSLQWAIFKYNAFWIPLPAKHSENPLSEEPLVVPLDCEWIWHCHRLNPIKYKKDCERMFGRILDNENVISSVQGTSKNKTEEIWNIMYPEEPYELDVNRNLSGDIIPGSMCYETFTQYDLVSAVARQTSFYSRVSGPYMSNDRFLLEAMARYKGFIHLIRRNKRENIRQFSVPTVDIDLMWHSHILHPASYCDDLYTIVGEVVGHDDNVTKAGKKVDTGLFEITKQWKETYGLSYKKIRPMFNGVAPTSVKIEADDDGCGVVYSGAGVTVMCVGNYAKCGAGKCGAGKCGAGFGAQNAARNDTKSDSDYGAGIEVKSARCWCLLSGECDSDNGAGFEVKSARCWCVLNGE